MERGAARQREIEREKEVEKEKARVERERVLAEREKARKEKLEADTAKAVVDAAAAKAALAVTLAAAASATAAAAAASATAALAAASVPVAVVVAAPLIAPAPIVPVVKPTVISILKREPGQVAGDFDHPRWALLASTTPSNNGAASSSVSTVNNSQLGDARGVNPSSSSNLLGNNKGWTASKSSADTITRIPAAIAVAGFSSSKTKSVLPATDSMADFPTLRESAPPRSSSVNVDLSAVGADDGQELGWSVRRTSPQKDRETSLAPLSSLSSSSLSSSTDIFSSMAERPAMSTDYTFKPSEKTIKAAEAKRLADSQQKAAAAAAAASSLSGTARGDFDEFLSNSSASYISNFSSSLRYNQTLSSETSNGLFFPTPSASIPQSQSITSSSSSRLHPGYVEPSNLGTAFSSSFSGLGFSSAFLSSPASSSGDLGGLRSNPPLADSRRHVPPSISPANGILDEDDDFTTGYFSNPLSTLGGLDLDDATDPLILAIGGLSMPSFTDNISGTHLQVPTAQSPARGGMPEQLNPQLQNQQIRGFPSTSYSMPAAASRTSQYAYPANSINSTSSSHPMKNEYASAPSPQRQYFNDQSNGVKQEMNKSPFPSMGSLGALSNSGAGFESFSMSHNGSTDDFSRDYFNGGQRQAGGGIGMPPPSSFGTQQPQLQSLMMFSPFRSQTPPSHGGHSPLDPEGRENVHHASMYADHNSLSNSHFPSSAPSSSSVPLPISGQEGIEADILPESAFISVAWLRQHGMHMYRWAGDVSEWTEYAMHLPPNVAPFFSTGPSAFASVIPELQTSGCKMWVDKETLMGREATFLVFLRGAAGQPSNACMNTALDILSNTMRVLLPQIASQSKPFGSIGSNRGPTSPPHNLLPSSMGMSYPTKQPSAWGGNGGPTFASGVGGGGRNDEEELSTMSDEYYDPEDLARSLQLLEGTDGSDSDWCTVSTKRIISPISTIRPEPLRVQTLPGGYVQRWLEIPRDSVGLVIGQGGKKIKDLCTLSGAKIQFRVNKTAEREGRPGLLELQGGAENVDQGLQLVWDLLHLLGKEYQEVPVQKLK